MDWNCWVVTQARLRDVPGGALLCEMPYGSLVHATGETYNVVYSGQPTVWAEVLYQTSQRIYKGEEIRREHKY